MMIMIICEKNTFDKLNNGLEIIRLQKLLFYCNCAYTNLSYPYHSAMKIYAMLIK